MLRAALVLAVLVAASGARADGLVGDSSTVPSSSPTSALLPFRINSPATGVMMAKNQPGRLYAYSLCNSAAAARYVRFYDSTAAVVGTTAVALGAIAVAAGSCQSFSSNFGFAFLSGIALSVTAANGDTDTTAGAAGDVSGFLGYR